ncbi:MAG: hypothetical protein IJ427_08100 [Lachnospiraceae bacterium]|nr:hypothetical protein [Lachnospiraceae bacterium]
MKNYKRLGILAGALLFSFTMVACGSREEEKSGVSSGMPPTSTVAPTDTPMPTVAPMTVPEAEETPTLTPAPTETPVPTEIPAEGVRISEENFGDTVFCEYLEKKFDADGNGFFSDEELTAIKEISFGSKVLQSPCTEIKGFSYFSELEHLTLNSAQRAEVCGVPKLTKIEITRGTGSWGMGAVKYRLGDLWIADCPALESVTIEDTVFIGKSGNEAGELRVTNCPLLRSVDISAEQLDRVGVRITETPMASFGLRKIEDGTEPAYYVFDTHLTQSVYLPEIDLNGGTLVLPKQGKVEWVGADATSFAEELNEFKELAEKLQSGFSFEIQEVQPALRDEEGRVGYIVHLDNKYLSERNYHVYARGLSESDFSKNSEYYGTAMLLFCKEPPSAGEFSVEREKPLIFEADSYSPVNGVYGSFSEYYGPDEQNGLGGYIVYTSGDRKEMLGELDVSIDFSVNREEGFAFWTGVKLEEETYCNVTEGVWLEENTVGEALPEEDAVPVTEDYFTSLLFREFIMDTVDLNRDGFLSREEREAVTSLSTYVYGIGPVVVDGLEYFPNLEMLSLPECREVVVRNCPKLKLIELTWCDKLVCQNCPELQEIEILGDGTAEVVTEGCPSVTSIITNEDDVCHCE